MRPADLLQVHEHLELALASCVVHDRLPVDICRCKVNIELVHERLQGLHVAKSANVVHQLGPLLRVDDVVIDWEVAMGRHQRDRKERALRDSVEELDLPARLPCVFLLPQLVLVLCGLDGRHDPVVGKLIRMKS